MPPSVIKALDYTVLPCSDMEGMKKFYWEIMGLEIDYEREDWIEFGLDHAALALRHRGDHLFPPTNNRSHPSVQLAFCVQYSDVDLWQEWLSTKGVDILEPPRNREWGHRTLYFHDPAGTVLEIYAEISS